MTTGALAFLMLIPFGFASASTITGLSGTWNVHNNFSGNESDTVCTFKQKDGDLTGTCKSDRGTGTITGKQDGNKIKWSYDSTYNGTVITIKYAGTLDAAGSKLAGAVTVVQLGADGVFTAVPLQ